ncbi:hypothetical protein [Bradyrhizobium monzae]|uniref:hypothetical protein n=1 Tax=Bradyrhizobium sp. Oc8 TaxID=2876780 RepID=UPI001F22819E|nr:hypothetical protein [Bradyrhizobium sp. Oc8]
MNVSTWPSMAKHDDSVNRIQRRNIADIMPPRAVRLMSPSTVSAHGLTGGEVNEMEPRAGRAGEGLEASPLASLPLHEMGLHVHARLRALENNQIGHRHRMAARQISSLIWISFGIASV